MFFRGETTENVRLLGKKAFKAFKPSHNDSGYHEFHEK